MVRILAAVFKVLAQSEEFTGFSFFFLISKFRVARGQFDAEASAEDC